MNHVTIAIIFYLSFLVAIFMLLIIFSNASLLLLSSNSKEKDIILHNYSEKLESLSKDTLQDDICPLFDNASLC